MRTIRTKAVGVTHRNDDGTSRQELIEYLRPGETLELVRDRYNEHDSNAVEILDGGGIQLGFLRRALAAKIAPLMDDGIPVDAVVTEVTGGDYGENFGLNIELRIYDGDDAIDLEMQAAHAALREREAQQAAVRAESYARETTERTRRQQEKEKREAISGAILIVLTLALLWWIFGT